LETALFDEPDTDCIIFENTGTTALLKNPQRIANFRIDAFLRIVKIA